MSTATKKGAEAQNSLFEPTPEGRAGLKEEIIHLPCSEIELDPQNPRVELDDELARSVAQEGVLQPITVVPNPDPEQVKKGKKYRVKFGARRLVASFKAERGTIRAIIDREEGVHVVRRRLQQLAENKHKPLKPIEEAMVLKQAMDEVPGMTLMQLHEVSGIPKTTITDRLALANAPEAFRPFFVSGQLTPSAAPILRKYADVPAAIMAKAADMASHDYRWQQAAKLGEPVELGVVEETLSRVIIDEQLGFVTTELALHYNSQTVKIDKHIYAIDADAFAKAEKVLRDIKRDEEKKAAADKAATSKVMTRLEDAGKVPPGTAAKYQPPASNRAEGSQSPSSPPPGAPSGMSAAERKRIDRDRLDRAKAERDQELWKVAKPNIIKAIEAAIKKASPKVMLGYVATLYAESCGVRVEHGNSADALVRAITTSVITEDITRGDIDRNHLPVVLKQAGLSIDLRKLLDEAAASVEKERTGSAKVKAVLGIKPEKKGKKKAAPKKPAKKTSKGKKR